MSKERRQRASKPVAPRWEFGPDIPTHDFFDDRPLEELWNLQEAVESFVYWLENGRFLSWEAVACEEQGLPLTRRQQEELQGLLNFGDEADEHVYYINDIPRASEPWHVILNKIAPHLLIEPIHTVDCHDDVICNGWGEILAALRKFGMDLSLPPGVETPEEVVPAELRHKLSLQHCYGWLRGVGYGDCATLDDPEEHYRVDEFIANLRRHQDSVAFFGLTLDSLLTKVILPEQERLLFVRIMQEKLDLKSMHDPIADKL